MPDDVSSRILAAAALAGQAAADVSEQRVEWRAIAPRLADRLMPQNRRLIAASGPSHWAAVARMLRGAESVGFEIPELINLADQITRDLGDGQ